MPVDPPNYTQVPNLVFDDYLSGVKSLAELKVVLAVVRATFGWHKKSALLSLSDLEGLTGLSRPSVVAGLSNALESEVLGRVKEGEGYLYYLVVKGFNPPSKDSLPEVVKSFNPPIEKPTIYKTLKKDKEKDMSELAVRVWNEEKLDNWTKHRSLTPRAVGQVRGLVKFFGEERLEEVLRAAIRHAKTNDFYKKGTFAFANIFSNDKGIEYAEAHLEKNAPHKTGIKVGALYQLAGKPGWVVRVTRDLQNGSFVCFTADSSNIQATRAEVTLSVAEIGDKING